MKTFKGIMIDAIDQTADCDHHKLAFATKCGRCISYTLERLARFHFAQELRLVLDIALDGVTDPAMVNSDYFRGWRDAIAHLDPSGQQFLDIISDVFTGNELSN